MVCKYGPLHTLICSSFWLLELFPERQIFRLVQIESICRRQYKSDRKNEIFLEMVETIVGKGENAAYQHFLLFSTIFSKGFIFNVVKNQVCLVKS